MSAGSHTVRVCGYANEDTDTTNASISVVWSAVGIASLDLATAPVEVTPEMKAPVEAANR